jgi:hypothetical protein
LEVLVSYGARKWKIFENDPFFSALSETVRTQLQNSHLDDLKNECRSQLSEEEIVSFADVMQSENFKRLTDIFDRVDVLLLDPEMLILDSFDKESFQSVMCEKLNFPQEILSVWEGDQDENTDNPIHVLILSYKGSGVEESDIHSPRYSIIYALIAHTFTEDEVDQLIAMLSTPVAMKNKNVYLEVTEIAKKRWSDAIIPLQRKCLAYIFRNWDCSASISEEQRASIGLRELIKNLDNLPEPTQEEILMYDLNNMDLYNLEQQMPV